MCYDNFNIKGRHNKKLMWQSLQENVFLDCFAAVRNSFTGCADAEWGMMMATIKDVASMAGVGISTVSRVINETKNVRPEVRVRVEKAIQETGYTTNRIARGLKISQTHSIVVIVTALSRIFFTSVLEGISKTAEKYGYSVFISQSNDNLETEMDLVQSYAAQWVDGIILASSAHGADARTERYCEMLGRLGKGDMPIPVVTLEYPCVSEHVDAVVVDHRKAAREAVTHLLDTGKRSILHIAVPLNTYMGQRRVEGYRDALEAHGIPLDERLIVEGDYTPNSGYRAASQIFDKKLPVDGIFAANDQMAVGALTACRERGISVPGQIGIIGNDNIFVASIVSPALSSIDVPRYEMGATAMELLSERIQTKRDNYKRRIITLPTRIITRESTVAGTSSDPKQLVDW